MAQPSEYLPKERVVLVVGNYGSGKTEVSVNLAINLAARHPVAIADLDIVNPYFRCREAREEMESHGIRVINPTGGYQAADLPIVLPEIRGAVQSAHKAGEGYVLLDVGGDDVGARILSSLADLFKDRSYAMLQVLNAKRPFTDSVEGCVRIKEEIEAASRLRVTGLVSNTHLMEETDADVILEGIELARAVGAATGLPLEFATASPSLKDDRDLEGGLADGEGSGDCPFLWIERRMLPPWKLKSKTDKAERILNRRSPGI